MVRTTTEADDESTPELAARHFAAAPSNDNFADLVDALEDEWERDGHDPVDDKVLSPTGEAVKLAADAMGYDVTSMIDFDGNDEVTIPYESMGDDADTKTAFAIPNDVARLVTFADGNTLRRVWFEDGAGHAHIFVEVKGRRDD